MDGVDFRVRIARVQSSENPRPGTLGMGKKQRLKHFGPIYIAWLLGHATVTRTEVGYALTHETCIFRSFLLQEHRIEVRWFVARVASVMI